MINTCLTKSVVVTTGNNVLRASCDGQNNYLCNCIALLKYKKKKLCTPFYDATEKLT